MPSFLPSLSLSLIQNQTQANTSPASLTPTHVETMYSSTESGRSSTTWHRGSHCQYTELLKKHQRHPHG